MRSGLPCSNRSMYRVDVVSPTFVSLHLVNLTCLRDSAMIVVSAGRERLGRTPHRLHPVLKLIGMTTGHSLLNETGQPRPVQTSGWFLRPWRHRPALCPGGARLPKTCTPAYKGPLGDCLGGAAPHLPVVLWTLR